MKYAWLCAAAIAALFLTATPVLAAGEAGKPGEQMVDPLDPQPEKPDPNVQKPDWMKYENPYVGEQNDLTNPHRTPEEVVAWVQNKATDMLTFTSSDSIAMKKADGADLSTLPEEANIKLTRIKPTFSSQGWAEYANYMTVESGLIDMVRKQNRSITTIINGTGAVFEKGAAAGAYHWSVKSPVMISITGIDMDGSEKTLQSGKFQLVVQVGRIAQHSVEDDGLAIEGWKVKPIAEQE